MTLSDTYPVWIQSIMSNGRLTVSCQMRHSMRFDLSSCCKLKLKMRGRMSPFCSHRNLTRTSPFQLLMWHIFESNSRAYWIKYITTISVRSSDGGWSRCLQKHEYWGLTITYFQRRRPALGRFSTICWLASIYIDFALDLLYKSFTLGTHMDFSITPNCA